LQTVVHFGAYFVFVLSLQLVEQVFSWFNSHDPKTWNSHMQEFPRYEPNFSYF